MKFISVKVKTAIVMHGYSDGNLEITETAPDAPFAEKLLAVDRIQSATEQYLLVTSSHGRVMYWEYEGGLAVLTQRLAAAGLVVPMGSQATP